jgi:hypothetical protein
MISDVAGSGYREERKELQNKITPEVRENV